MFTFSATYNRLDPSDKVFFHSCGHSPVCLNAHIFNVSCDGKCFELNKFLSHGCFIISALLVNSIIHEEIQAWIIIVSL